MASFDDSAKVPGGVVAAVEPGSLGQAVGIRPGDRLLAVNGHSLRDVIDVRFYSAEDRLELLVERSGDRLLIETERQYGQGLGLTFTHLTFDVDVRRCANNCDFCFVKQNAPGMRRSLYVKDDDYRYSFLSGSFVTLTNLTDDDWARLDEQRLSPLYVSVHTTDPELRRRFLGRPAAHSAGAPGPISPAPDVIRQLRRLAEMGIEVHTQVVLVPGLNGGEHLARTVADLTNLYQEPVASLSVVPIGLTRYHSGSCRPYTPPQSRAVLDQVEPWRRENRKKKGCTFVYPSDEWYLVAEREVPASKEYDGFPQVENGVGMVRLLLDEWRELKAGLPGTRLKPATLACGMLIFPVLARIVEELNSSAGSDLRLVPVANDFFGPVTTVSGLLTGQDVVAALQGRPLGELVLLPRAMFTGSYGAGSAPPDSTLDDMSLAGISERLGVPAVMAGTLTEALTALTTGP
jgi:putative radical SAM enzyme (TIGR03279 family)